MTSRKLSVIGLDFNALYQNQLVKADSVFLEKPLVVSEIFIREKAKRKGLNERRALLDSTLNQLPMAFNIRHLVMQNGRANIGLHQGGKSSRLSAANDNISVSGFHLNDSGKKEFKIDGFKYTIRNYTSFLPDSTLKFSCDSLQFIDDHIVLHHFKAATPHNGRNKVLRDYLIPRLEITGMDWLTFIFQNKFIAREAVLYQPVLKADRGDRVGSAQAIKPRRSVYQNLLLLDELIDLEKLRIINGDLSLKRGRLLELQINSFNLSVNVEKLGKARSPDDLVSSLKQLSFEKAAVSTPSLSIATGHFGFYANEQKFIFDSIRVDTKNGDIVGTFKDVEAQDFSYEHNQLEISKLFWKEGSVHIDAAKPGVPGEVKSDRTVWFFIEKMSGNNTWLHYAGKGVTGKAFLHNISASKISRSNKSTLQTEGFMITGNQAYIGLPAGVLEAADFDLRDEENSIFREVVFRRNTPVDSVLVHIPSIRFIPNIEQTLLTRKLTLDTVTLDQPQVVLFTGDFENNAVESDHKLVLPGINIKGFRINDAALEVNKAGLATSARHISAFVASAETQPDSALLAGNITVQSSDVFLRQRNGDLATSDILTTELDHFRYHPPSGAWDLQLKRLETEHVAYESTKQEKHMLLSVNKMTLETLKANHTDLDSAASWFINRSGASMAFDSLQIQNETNILHLARFRFDGKQRQASLHSSSIDPALSRVEFYKDLVYRKIYLNAKTGEIEVNGLEMKNDGLQVSLARVDSAALSIYADKLKKFRTGIIQPLPVKALTDIGFPFQVDEITLRNARVDYTELSPISSDTGSVYFSSIDAKIENVSSRSMLENDSLRLNVAAVFLGRMPLQLDMRQSYRDKLGGLRLGINLGPGDLTMLNPFLAPLVSVRARSGQLDSLRMTAIGNDYVSKGLMNLHYRNLKADLLDSGNVSKQKFRTRLIGFLANTVAVKDNNTKNEVSFVFVRNRQKSTIVYFLRMVVAGAAGSIAPLSNIFFKKQFKNSIRNVQKHARLAW